MKTDVCPSCGTPAAYVSEGIAYCSYGHAMNVQVDEVSAGMLDAKQREVYERWLLKAVSGKNYQGNDDAKPKVL